MSYFQETDADPSTSSITTDIWKNILIDEGDFEFNPDNDDDENIALDDDDFSTTTNIGSHTTESTNYDSEILPFVWDEVAFRKAQELSLLEEKRDQINWEDTDFEENFETESTITRFTDEEHNFEIKDTNILSTLPLTACVILDINDNGEIQCCSKTGKNQRPLAQLIGTWEIDENIFTKMKAENKLHTLGVRTSHFTFDQNKLHSLHLKQ
ncbi:unnamed protein product [Rhizophagus irregularis]|uniref:Uncharacterized protein n=1 Tax=Rhizophagus irregularis TaxID=588596 RepID=A0A2N1MBX8_9GLOM|nr:hypothetical protein RhiirC2_795282 [Rhizophagus irregularis]CAB5326417.1 unnamed protein product [Rhizophagus irregularis]